MRPNPKITRRCYFKVALFSLMLLSGGAQSMDRQRLDACETYLGNGYERCRACELDIYICDAQWTTDKCQLPWKERYSRFIDRRIEEMAAERDYLVKFIGLSRLKPKYVVAGGK